MLSATCQRQLNFLSTFNLNRRLKLVTAIRCEGAMPAGRLAVVIETTPLLHRLLTSDEQHRSINDTNEYNDAFDVGYTHSRPVLLTSSD